MAGICQFQIGDIVEIADKIDPENQPTVIATVRHIERDTELDLFWLYLMANEEVLNTNIDPKIGCYWDLISDNSDYIRLLSRATIS